jgi:hypothetical protein
MPLYGGYHNNFLKQKQKLRENYFGPMDVPFVYPEAAQKQIKMISTQGLIHSVNLLTLVENYLESPEGLQLIDERIEQRLKELSIDDTCIDMSRVLNDDEAKVEIESYIKDIQKKGIYQIDLLDLIAYLNLPGEQIERIMEELENKGVNPIE